MAVYPYAMNSISAVTLPDIDDTPTTLKASDLLAGVNITSNSVAVKPEFAWQELREFDLIICSADASDQNKESVATRAVRGEKMSRIAERCRRRNSA